MKIILFLLIVTLLSGNRINIELIPTKSEVYTIQKDIGIIGFNFFNKKNIFFFQNQISNLHNPIYQDGNSKSFWLLTDGFIDILKRYKFTGEKYIYFTFFNLDNNKVYKDMYLGVKLNELKKFDNRDFSKYDKKLIDSNNDLKYKILPIRRLFKTTKIFIEKNNKLSVSKKLTKKYHKFINGYTFNTIGMFEFTIENNFQELKSNIYTSVSEGNYKKVEIYVELGFNIDNKDDQNHQTLLQYAALNGHYNIVKLLIKHGANPNIHKKGFETAYDSAKRKNYLKIIQLLKPITNIKTKNNTVKNYCMYLSLNKDINMCNGMRNVRDCYTLTNNKDANMCLGIATGKTSYCYALSNNQDINMCLGASTRNTNYCYTLSNNQDIDMCLGMSGKISHCNYLKNNRDINMCMGVGQR